MAFSDDLDRPNRCQGTTKFGVRCKCPTTKYDPNYCIFHSKVQALVPVMHQGRVKGASKPEKVRTVKKSVGFLGNISDLISFLNRMGNQRLLGQIDDSLFETSLRMAAGLLKCFEQRDVRDGLDQLEGKLENLIEKARLKNLNLGDVDDEQG